MSEKSQSKMQIPERFADSKLDLGVYGKENKNCIRRNCKGKIFKTFISNRSSFFCTSCQKKIN